MASKALTSFDQKVKAEVTVLRDLVSELSGSAPGRREDRFKVLHRSSIILLTAAFERYCESILIEAAEILSKYAKNPLMLPKALRKNVASQKQVEKNKNELFAWDFAGDGWRDLVVSYVLRRTGALNTPNSDNIRMLFDDLLGISDITTSWGRKGMKAVNACDRLDDWIERRGDIAHGAEGAAVILADVQRYEDFLRQTVTRTDSSVELELGIILKNSSWTGFPP